MGIVYLCPQNRNYFQHIKKCFSCRVVTEEQKFGRNYFQNKTHSFISGESQKNQVTQAPSLENMRKPVRTISFYIVVSICCLQAYEMSKTSMIIMAVLITIFIWFLLGTMFICYKMKNAKQKSIRENKIQDSRLIFYLFLATRFEDQCDKSTCPSLVSSKYFYPERLQPVRTKNKKPLPETDTSDSDVPAYLKCSYAIFFFSFFFSSMQNLIKSKYYLSGHSTNIYAIIAYV